MAKEKTSEFEITAIKLTIQNKMERKKKQEE